MIKNKTFAMLTEAEIDAEAELTKNEKTAVDAVIAAVKALPKNFCLSVDDEGLWVQKKITRGYCQGVASVKRAGLKF